MFAIFEALGRQYKVSVGDRIKVDRISAESKEDAESGTKVTFTNVLFLGEADKLENAKIGAPLIAGAKVVGTIVEQGRDPKGVSFTYKRRKAYRRKVGYRRAFTTVEIQEIKAA